MRILRRVVLAALTACLIMFGIAGPASAGTWTYTSYNTSYHCGGNIPEDGGHFNVCVTVSGSYWQGVVLWTKSTSEPNVYADEEEYFDGAWTPGWCDMQNLGAAVPPHYYACFGATHFQPNTYVQARSNGEGAGLQTNNTIYASPTVLTG